jgi:ABC-2 type transport system ATP-binding protein
MTVMLILDGLTKHFGVIKAVNDVSMTLKRGEVLGFLGPNGAGKSTTMKMVAGFLEPTSGTASICGVDVGEQPIEAKRLLGYLPEGAPAYDDMSVASFLDFVAGIRGISGKIRKGMVSRAVERTDLGDVLGQRIGTLSKGFKRRVGLAQAIVHDPEVLVLDEPTDGLDPTQKHQVRSLIQAMAPDKVIVISTHILEEIDAVCTRAALIAGGRLLLDTTPDDLAARASNHNNVVLTIDSAQSGSLTVALSGVPEIANVEQTSLDDGTVQLRIVPKGRVSVFSTVTDIVHGKGVKAREIFVERGALDQAFREVTETEPPEMETTYD